MTGQETAHRPMPADEAADKDRQERLARRQKTLDFLSEHGIRYELFTHPPLPTVKEALEYWKDVDATHCKNLFFRNHKGNRHYLVVLECHKDLDIHSLEHLLHQGKLSFASEERMLRCLGLKPGSVSPLGLMNDIGISAAADPKELFENGQVAFQYVDPVTEEVTMDSPYNPNGSYYAIEGIISRDGQILGKMGHTERYEKNTFKNIEEELEQPLFSNAVNYFRGK